MHHKIVHVDQIHCPLLELEIAPPHTAEIIKYDRTFTKEELHERIKDATIVISIAVRIDAPDFDAAICPRLQYVAISSTGADKIDVEAAAKRGIWVTNAPGANIDSVSEHAIGLYFAARRSIIRMHDVVIAEPSEWKQTGTVTRHMALPDRSLPPTIASEVCGIVGYGALGQRIAYLAKQLGMKVLIADRKGSTKSASELSSSDPPRLSFEQVLAQSSVLFICVPFNKSTIDMISTPEFERIPTRAVVINIARGGIVNETAVVAALRAGKLAGFATDVTEKEPAEGAKDSPLLDPQNRDLNITISPHVAWFSGQTVVNLQRRTKETVEAWIKGEPINVLVRPAEAGSS